ncbi:uncharacterized [Tachysurus ichikawai]
MVPKYHPAGNPLSPNGPNEEKHRWLHRTEVRGLPSVGMNRYAGRKAPLKMLTLTLKIPAINRRLTRGAAERKKHQDYCGADIYYGRS